MNGTVYLSAQKFLAVRFLERFEKAQKALRLQADGGPVYQAALDALSDEFDGVFFKACVKKRTFPYKPTLLDRAEKVKMKVKKADTNNDHCLPSHHAFCCETGAICDCSKSADSVGQCSQVHMR